MAGGGLGNYQDGPLSRYSEGNSADTAVNLQQSGPEFGKQYISKATGGQDAGTQDQNSLAARTNNAAQQQYFAAHGVNVNQPGWQSQLSTAQYQQLMTGATEYGNKAEAAVAYPDSTLDKIMMGAAMAIDMAGLAVAGAALAPELAVAMGANGAIAGTAAGMGTIGTGLGAVGAGAITGAGVGAVSSALQGQNIGKGALLGAVGGGIGGGLNGVAGGAANSLSGATGLDPTLANMAVKGAIGAGTGAVTQAIGGGNIAAGAIGGGVGGAVSSGVGGLTGNNQIGSIAGKIAGGYAASTQQSPNNVQRGIAAGTGVAGSVGAMVGNNMGGAINPSTGVNPQQAAMTTPQLVADPTGGNAQTTTSNAIYNPNQSTAGSVLQTGIGLGSTLLGTIGNAQYGSAVGNVLSNAQNGAGVGTNTSYSGPNSTGTIQNGQVSNQLNGGLNLANTGLGNIANQQQNIAGSFNGQLPQNVANAINQQAGQNSQLPQGTQGMLNQQSGLQNAVQNNQFGLMNAGNNTINNPLVQNLQNAAQTQLGTAGQSFTNTYNTQLAALNQSLALPTQQAEAELANTQFGRGQLGTSGGALQTQAFAQGLGQAYLGNQQTAYNEALNAQNSATNNAANLSGAANNVLGTGNSLLANAYGQFNNTSQLNTNTANSIFGQNSNISQLANQYGQQNVGNQITAAQLPGSLTGQYLQNTNTAIGGATGLTNLANSGTNAALAAGQQQGNQYNNAMFASGNILNSKGMAATGGNPYGAIGNGVNAAFGSNGVAGGIGNQFSKLFGGGGGDQTPPTDSNGMIDTGGMNIGNPDGTIPGMNFGPGAGNDVMMTDPGSEAYDTIDPSSMFMPDFNIDTGSGG